MFLIEIGGLKFRNKKQEKHSNPVPFHRWVNQTGAKSERCRSDILSSLIQAPSGGSSHVSIIPLRSRVTRPPEADGETEKPERSRINPQFPLLTIGKPETYNPQWSANGGAEQPADGGVRGPAFNQQEVETDRWAGPSRTAAGDVWVHSAGSPGTMSSLSCNASSPPPNNETKTSSLSLSFSLSLSLFTRSSRGSAEMQYHSSAMHEAATEAAED